jgi:hypothetical protein
LPPNGTGVSPGVNKDPRDPYIWMIFKDDNLALHSSLDFPVLASRAVRRKYSKERS